MSTKIVVLTPIKNEDWILEKFLTAVSLFADVIIVADQQSNDRSEAIARSFPKVVFLRNENPEYDEFYRQKLLIDSARHLVPGRKLLLALDADELPTATVPDNDEWQKIFELAPGTVIRFPKHDVILSSKSVIYHKDSFPLGYIDDGGGHSGKKIHSPRVPITPHTKFYNAEQIVFMHYALTRPNEYWARQRLYAMIENLKGIQSLHRRLLSYSPRLNDFSKKFKLAELPEEWLKGWDEKNINLRDIPTSDYNHYNRQIIEILLSHGGKRFWLDDIWGHAYSEIAEFYNYPDADIRLLQSQRPSRFHSVLRTCALMNCRLFEYAKGVRGKLKV